MLSEGLHPLLRAHRVPRELEVVAAVHEVVFELAGAACTMLCYAMLRYTTLYYANYTYYIILYYIILYYIILYYIILYIYCTYYN